ncbi:MAG: biotin transporter BioY [Oscillospiraceae bacterium]
MTNLNNSSKAKNRTVGICMCALFTALTAVGAFIKIPIPYMEFTLQFLFTTLAGLLLGAKRGAASVGVYVILGLIGIPIFAEGGGFFYVLKPTFGYLIGFIIGTFVTGKIANAVPNPSFKRILAANFAGLGIVYALGIVYFYFAKNLWIEGGSISFAMTLWYCFVLAVPGDILLCLLAAILGKRLIPIVRKYIPKEN